MSEKLLLLPSAKSGRVLEDHWSYPYLRIALIAIGLLVVLVGAVNVLSRAAHSMFGNTTSPALTNAFLPAAALGSPQAVEAITGATSTPAGVIIPTRIKIPSIGVDAAVEQVGKKADGSMGTPSGFSSVGWYAPGAKPGESGNAVMDGHVNNALTLPGVFANLSKVQKNDYITVSDAQGKALIYRVTEVTSIPADTAPADSIFTKNGPSQLVLITCDGEWVQAEHSFDKRLVVFARLAY